MARLETDHSRRRASPLKVMAAATAAWPTTWTGPRQPSGERDSIHDGTHPVDRVRLIAPRSGKPSDASRASSPYVMASTRRPTT